jgi:hypothetical protein
MTREKVPCPECGVEYYRGPGITMHRKSAHGVQPAGNAALRKRDRERKRRSRAKAKSLTPTTAQVDAGSELTADDILVSFVSMRWPERMPTSVMAPLLDWREATSRMLERTQ